MVELFYFYEISWNKRLWNTAQQMKFSINEFFSKCDQICPLQGKVGSVSGPEASMESVLNPLGVNLKKCSNTFKQFVCHSRRIVWVCLFILWGWRLKG